MATWTLSEWTCYLIQQKMLLKYISLNQGWKIMLLTVCQLTEDTIFQAQLKQHSTLQSTNTTLFMTTEMTVVISCSPKEIKSLPLMAVEEQLLLLVEIHLMLLTHLF